MSSSQAPKITWLGHATVLVQTPKGTNILIDPFIEHNPKYPKGYELPEKIDYVLLTHGHGDHISDAVPVATRHGSTVVAIYELAAYVESKGITKTIGMNLGERCNSTMLPPLWWTPGTLPAHRMRREHIMWVWPEDLS